MKKLIGTAAILAVSVGTASAQTKKTGLGPFDLMKYRSYGIIETRTHPDGAIVKDVEQIETIQHHGEYEWYGPGQVFHLRNVSKERLCVALLLDANHIYDSRRMMWGSGTVYNMKPGQRVKQAGSIYFLNSGSKNPFNLSYKWRIETWTPQKDKTCGPNPYA